MKSLIKIKAWIVMFATVVLSLTTMGASTGSHIGKPGSISVGSTKTVTLVNEYDGEEYYDSGAYYLKVKLNKYSEYTVTASGCASLTVETDWEDENSPLASFDDYEIGDKFYSVLTSDGWDEDDPNVGEFYIYVDGEIGDKVVVSVSSGNNLPVGIAENPNVIKLQSTQSTTTKLSLSNYEYYFEAQLKEGRKYTFQTVGGTTNNVLQLSSSADFDYYEITEELVGDEEGNMKVTIYPNEDGEFTIIVNGDEETGTFQLSHKVELEKTIAAHDVIELNKENGFATEIKPGYVNNPESGFYDNIIDEALCKVALKKGASYIFETEGAATNLLLAVYDAKGERKALIQGPVAGSYDLIYAMTAEEDGSYYFGVAQDIDELGIKAGVPESPVYAPVTVRIREIDLADDNVHPLSALPASGVGMKPEEVDVEGTGPFVLDESHWSQTFAVGARKGLSYHIKAVAGADTAFTLTADVFTRKSNGGENSVSTKEPIDIGDGITIEAEENATYYVRVTVAEGKGYCYPEFTMHCSATSSDGEALGILTVFTKGADGTWSLNSEKTAYESGVSILVAGKNTVKFSKEQDRSKPADEVVEMEAGKTTVITGVYNDTYDPQDDTAAGAFKMNISAKATVIDRTLYADDEFDNLSFVAKDGVYYNFAFTDVSGDCVFSITNAEFGVVCEGVTSAMKIALSASKSPYYVVVHHENETPEDGRYIMEATSANVGAIKFAKTTVSAKENAAYADVVVNRTAKEGAVRVRFGTVAGTAQPGREYYPTNGVIYWADGDNKAKTIRVRLIPDVIPTYEGAAKLFSVKLEAFEEDELEDDNEYVAKILTETVAVSLTEVSKKAPGTISVISYNDGSDDYELANPKNPEVFVCAGEDLTLNLARSEGADGIVGVKIALTKGTAAEGVDFGSVSTNLLVWGDGDASAKTITIPTVAFEDTGSYAESKKFTVRFTAVSGKLPDGVGSYENAKLAASSVNAVIESEFADMSMETYAKGLPRNGGVGIKTSKSGTWYLTFDNEFCGTPMSANEKRTITFNLTGPGLFKATPSLSDTEGGAYITAKIGKTELGNVVDTDVAAVIPSGSQNVEFTINAGSKAGMETDGEALDIHPSFAPFQIGDDMSPYFWVSLANVSAAYPADKSVVTSANKLQWNAPAVLEEESGFFYRVSIDSDKKLLGTEKALFTAVSAESEVSLEGVELKPGVTYYWRVDFGYSEYEETAGIEWIVSKNMWSFQLADGVVSETVVLSGSDINGVAIGSGERVTLMQGVATSFAIGATNVESTLAYSVAAGKLPDGLKLDTKKGVVSGVPSKSGVYSALLQTKNGRIAGSTVALNFEVLPVTTAVGQFTGLAKEDGSALTNGLPALGIVSFTATEAGKLSAKITIAGKAYTFTANGYESVLEREAEGDAQTDYSTLRAVLTQISKSGTVAYTNTLEITMTDASLSNIADLGKAAGSFVLTMAVPDMKGKGVQEDIIYAGELWRDNSKLTEVLAAQAPFVGYYTVALVPSGESDGAPKGHGYLTLTLDAKGKVKIAGALADGTKVSGSSVASVTGTLIDEAENTDRVLVVPFAVSKSPYCFGGELRVMLKESAEGVVTPVIDSETVLIWNNDNADATYDGEEGWRENLTPVGGMYNTIVNLQSYYLSRTFELSVSEDLPEELLSEGYSFTADFSPAGLPVDVVGDAVSVAKKQIAKESGSNLTDLENSVNPWDVKVSFKRATGIVSGTFNIWTEGFNTKGDIVQKEIKGLKHEGVLLLARDSAAPLADDVWTSGYYLAPVNLPSGKKTRKWNCSLPFFIMAIDQGDIDWWENDWGTEE